MKENQLSLHDVIAIGISKGIEAYEGKLNENIRSRDDRRLRNTRLLLENYHIFMAHAKETVYINSKLSAMDILEDIDSMLDSKQELVLESIKRSAERTFVMIQHMNNMLRLYKIYAKECKNTEEMRRFTVMRLSYIDKRRYTNEEMAIKFRFHVRGVQRDKRLAIETYSRFLFGVDSLKMPFSVSQSCR